MSVSVVPPRASPPFSSSVDGKGGSFSYTELELDLVGAALGRTARGLLRATPVLPSRDGQNYCLFGRRSGPVVHYTGEGRYSLPVLMHEAGHAYHVHMLRGLSLIAETWRCEAFAYYAVLRAHAVLLADGLAWCGFSDYLAAHEALTPRAMGLARLLVDEPPERAARLALAGDGYAP